MNPPTPWGRCVCVSVLVCILQACSPPSEVSTQRCQLITTCLGSHPARKYRHGGGHLVLYSWEPIPHGSIDTEVANYYYTPGIPPGTEVTTQRWPPRTILVEAHPPRKYRHGNLGPQTDTQKGPQISTPVPQKDPQKRKYLHRGGKLILHN